MSKLKVHLLILPRWFAIPFFATAVILGSILAGGSFSDINLWLGLIAVLLIMAGGHSFNSFLDYSWTGLDKGEVEDRSAEKSYTGGQNLLARGMVSPHEVLINALSWYVVALVPLFLLSIWSTWWVLPAGLLGMSITFWYSKAKFNWTHELSLAVGTGPFPILLGMFAVNSSPNWIDGLIVGGPFAIIVSFGGLALDEWPDAEANLKKGVKSIAFKVWEYGIDLSTYLMLWVALLYVYQVFLITIGLLAPLTGLTFIVCPLFIANLVMLKGNFEKAVPPFVLIGFAYVMLLVVGQAIGGG